MRISKGYWIWGLFPAKETYFLNEIKAKVQSKLKSPSFQTHITLSGPYLKIDNIFLKNLKTFAKSNSVITLNIDGYGFRQEIYKSFFISIKNSCPLKELRKNIYKLNKFDLENNYLPHISLAYGNHEKKDKKELISKLSKIKHTITLSKIALVLVDENINLWKILESYDLN